MNNLITPLWDPTFDEQMEGDSGIVAHVMQCLSFGPFKVIKLTSPIDASGDKVDRRVYPYGIADCVNDVWFGGSQMKCETFLPELNLAYAKYLMTEGTKAENL